MKKLVIFFGPSNSFIDKVKKKVKHEEGNINLVMPSNFMSLMKLFVKDFPAILVFTDSYNCKLFLEKSGKFAKKTKSVVVMYAVQESDAAKMKGLLAIGLDYGTDSTVGFVYFHAKIKGYIRTLPSKLDLKYGKYKERREEEKKAEKASEKSTRTRFDLSSGAIGERATKPEKEQEKEKPVKNSSVEGAQPEESQKIVSNAIAAAVTAKTPPAEKKVAVVKVDPTVKFQKNSLPVIKKFVAILESLDGSEELSPEDQVGQMRAASDHIEQVMVAADVMEIDEVTFLCQLLQTIIQQVVSVNNPVFIGLVVDVIALTANYLALVVEGLNIGPSHSANMKEAVSKRLAWLRQKLEKFGKVEKMLDDQLVDLMEQLKLK